MGSVRNFGVLAGMLALMSASSAGAYTAVSSTSSSCSPAFAECLYAPTVFGPGATSQYSRFYPSTGGGWLTDASMYVDFDLVAAYARSSGVGIVDYPGIYTFTARSTGNLQDLVTVGSGGGAGTLRSVWRVRGSTHIAWTNAAGVVQASMSCFVTGAPPGSCQGVVLQTTFDEVFDETIHVDMKLVFGVPTQYQLTFGLSASTIVTLPANSPPMPFQAVSNGEFGNSFELVDVQVLDALGQPLTGVPITSESGFDYTTVPEPGLAGTIAIGGLGLLGFGRIAPRTRGRHGQRIAV